MGTKKIDFFFSKKFEIEFDLYFDLCWIAEIIQVGLNMHLYVDIGDASSSLWGSTSSLIWSVKQINSFYGLQKEKKIEFFFNVCCHKTAKKRSMNRVNFVS